MTPGTLCPTLFEQCVGSFTSQRVVNTEESQDWAYCFFVLIQEDKRVKSFADVITEAALPPQLFKDPECWSCQGSHP